MSQSSNLPVHPGAYVKVHVFPDGMKVTKAAEMMGIGRPALSNFLNGNANLSQAMATRLEKAFGADKDALLAMQQEYDAFLNSEQENRIAVRSYTPSFLSITAKNIEAWADKSIKARALLAAFLRRLANSTGSKILHIDFPAHDNSQRHGWDGYVEAGNATPWVPEGLSGWEFGCNQDPSKKANGDYKARTKSIQKQDRAKTVFIFVTPLNWPDKDKWADAKRAEKEWKDVRAYDANNLEQWLEQSIPGQVWMANQLGIPQEGCQTLPEYWNGWSGATTPPISPKIFDSSIQAHQNKLANWHAGTATSSLIVTAGSKEEALAFIANTALNVEGLAPLAEQAVLVSTADAAKKLAAMSTDFIPIAYTRDAEMELARSAQNRRAIVIAEKSAIGIDPDITVELPSFESFKKALTDMGFDDAQIDRYSNQTGKSPTILRRHLANLPALKTPTWATDSTRIKTMVPLVLAGAWRSDLRGDQEILNVLAGVDNPDIEKNVAELARLDDAPIWSEGQYRGVVSKLDCFNAIASQITVEDLDNFFFIAEVVLSEDDPALDLPKDDRWAANFYEKVRDHSGAIRQSICETLIILAVYGNGLFGKRLGGSAEGRVTHLIRKLLENQDSRVWQSQQGDLPMYAEAAPDVFLDIVDQELTKTEPAFAPLFEPVDGGVMFSRCERTGILWALELLAWHPSRLARVVRILAKLCKYKLEDNWAHKPISSLNDILLSWMPHTTATLKQRCDVLTLLCKEYPDVGWDICMMHIKPGSSSTSGTYRPSWRGDASGGGQGVTHKDNFDFLRKCRELALSRSSHTQKTLADLIDCLSVMDDKDKKAVSSRIKDWLKTSPSNEDILKLRERIRTSTLTYRARLRHKGDTSRYADGKELYDLLEPKDVVLKHQWLFAKNWVEYFPEELIEEELDHDERERRLNKQKVAALKEIVAATGDEGFLRLCVGGEAGSNIGWHLGHDVMDAEQLLAFAVKCLAIKPSDETRQIDGCISGMLHQFENAEDGQAFTQCLLETVAQSGSNLNQQVRILKNAPFTRDTWEQAETMGTTVATEYWKNVIPHWVRDSREDLNYLVEKLMEVERPRAAFNIAHLEPGSIDSERLIKLLNAIGLRSSEPDGHYQPAAYEIEQALESLDHRDDVDRMELVRLEYQYIDPLTPGSKYAFPNLSRELAQSPLLFMQMVALCYRRDDDGKDPDAWGMPADPEHVQNLAKRAISTLEYTREIPGTQKDGTINTDQLREWIIEVRKLAKENGRADITDQKIGLVLSRCDTGSDGIWPREEVRQVFEEVAAPEISIGMEIGLYNSGGAHIREVDSARERNQAKQFHDHADAIMNEMPFTSRMLRSIAKKYERDAEWWDSDARLQQRLRG